MRTRLLVALAAGLMIGSADPAPDLGEVAQAQVIPPGSRWLWTDSEGDTFVYAFGKDGLWRTYSGGCELPGTAEKYILTPTACPPRIDTIWRGLDRHGIYRLEGGRLLICQASAGAGRPTSFAHRPETNHYLYVLKRLK